MQCRVLTMVTGDVIIGMVDERINDYVVFAPCIPQIVKGFHNGTLFTIPIVIRYINHVMSPDKTLKFNKEHVLSTHTPSDELRFRYMSSYLELYSDDYNPNNDNEYENLAVLLNYDSTGIVHPN